MSNICLCLDHSKEQINHKIKTCERPIQSPSHTQRAPPPCRSVPPICLSAPHSCFHVNLRCKTVLELEGHGSRGAQRTAGKTDTVSPAFPAGPWAGALTDRSCPCVPQAAALSPLLPAMESIFAACGTHPYNKQRENRRHRRAG